MKDQYRAALDRARREDKRVALGPEAVSKQYDLDQLPVTIVFDRSGKRVKRFEGFIAEDALQAVVQQSLQEACGRLDQRRPQTTTVM